MTDDEKLAERCLERRLRLTAGQARDLAEKDFDWIKSKGAKPVGGLNESGSPSALSDVKPVLGNQTRMGGMGTDVVVPEHYVIETMATWDKVDPDEIKRMSES